MPALDEDELLAIVAQQAVPFVLILDCVQDPHNLGAILRTADAAGVHAVVAPKDKAVGITETVRRVSVGAADHVPFAQVTNLARAMEKLKAAGLWLVGTSDHATSKSLYDLDLTGPLALVMGAEGKVAACAELAWEAKRVAVFLSDHEADQTTFVGAGWQTFSPDIESVVPALTQ